MPPPIARIPNRKSGLLSRIPPRGAISDVTLKNIRVLQAANTDVVLMADGPMAPISDIKIDNVVINGVKLKSGDARLKLNQWVTKVKVR